MKNSFWGRKFFVVVSLLAMLHPIAFASAQTAEPIKLIAPPGATIVLDSDSCIKPFDVIPATAGKLKILKSSEPTADYAIFEVATDRSTEATVTIEIGGTGANCDGGKKKSFVITGAEAPQISSETLSTAFNILMTAFVLALLLENAFALLFNWRVFLEFFVNRAWRTPIMFLGALLVVRSFDLDLMATLFDAFSSHQNGAKSRGDWFTSALTAAILAGGSVGVNRILVNLGFRSQIRPEVLQPKLNETDAWVSVRVLSSTGSVNAEVNIDEVLNPSNASDIPTTIGFVRSNDVGRRVKEILFPSTTRIPRSGGRTVSSDKYYRITVKDMETGEMYDTSGNKIGTISQAEIFKFGSRAIVDFDVTLT